MQMPQEEIAIRCISKRSQQVPEVFESTLKDCFSIEVLKTTSCRIPYEVTTMWYIVKKMENGMVH